MKLGGYLLPFSDLADFWGWRGCRGWREGDREKEQINVEIH
jgi:hypothetical protein